MWDSFARWVPQQVGASPDILVAMELLDPLLAEPHITVNDINRRAIFSRIAITSYTMCAVIVSV